MTLSSENQDDNDTDDDDDDKEAIQSDVEDRDDDNAMITNLQRRNFQLRSKSRTSICSSHLSSLDSSPVSDTRSTPAKINEQSLCPTLNDQESTKLNAIASVLSSPSRQPEKQRFWKSEVFFFAFLLYLSMQCLDS